MINKLRDEIHQNAKEHGWWEEERSFGEIIALCHSELSEALEEHRNGKTATEIYTKCKMDAIKKVGYGGCGVCKNCPVNKPEGIPIELADTIIRILDYCGKAQIDINSLVERRLPSNEYKSFAEFITVCHYCLSRSFYQDINFGDGNDWLATTISTIQCYCGKEGIDIEEAIRIKHEYNKTRPYKHGGKRI